jgi:hypothetical protein
MIYIDPNELGTTKTATRLTNWSITVCGRISAKRYLLIIVQRLISIVVYI